MRYRDAFLALHRLSFRKYELSALRTGSIRDQILRATMLVQRLVYAEFLTPDGYGLLVLGGGAAGVAASLSAAELGIRVTLVEQRSGGRLFETQRAAPNRWIDPCEFDWPHSIWRPPAARGGNHRPRSVWPSDQLDSPLEFEANSAYLLAEKWQRAYEAYVKKYPGRIELISGADATRLLFSETSHHIDVVNIPAATTRFAAAISCIGFAGEKTTLNGASGVYNSFKFWGDDPYTLPNLGLRPPPRGTGARRPIKVLVSGSGDGAQQDIARILTRKFGRELFEAIEAITGEPFIGPEDLLAISEADDKAKRAYAWRPKEVRPDGILVAWHGTYEKVVDNVWANIKTPQRDKLVASVLISDIHLTWITREQEPDFCYGLNRFLTLLLFRIIEHANRRPIKAATADILQKDLQWIRNHYISDIYCTSGAAMPPTALTAHDVKKSVQIMHRTAPPQPQSIVRLGDFDVVVLRHGVVAKPLFDPGAPVFEQLVPYDFVV